MNALKPVALSTLLGFLSPQIVFGQAFGEYGRAVGGVGQRQGNISPGAPQVSGPSGTGKGGGQGVGDLGGRAVPSQLVVAAKQAPLYSRQDDESEKIGQLSQGETLVPMVQSTNGNTGWYMVKTQTGTIGWIKASDVREESAKKR